MKIARGSVFRGSTISSDTIGASSKPAKAKQSLEKTRINPSSEKRGKSSLSRIGFAGPKRTRTSTAITRRKTIGSQLPRPPMFWIHFPAFQPITLTRIAMRRRASDPERL